MFSFYSDDSRLILFQIEGITTIRSFGWESLFEKDNLRRLETSQKPLYLLLCLQRWLNVVLDLLITVIATVLVASIVVFKDSISGAQVGIALNMIIAANTTLLRLVETWTTLETSIGAISRLRSVDETTPSEENLELLEPEANWPSQGALAIDEVTASYRYVLTIDMCMNNGTVIMVKVEDQSS